MNDGFPDLPTRRMAQLIAALKRDRGIPQARLEPLIGMKPANISKLKNGDKHGLASLFIWETQQRIGLDPHYFFDPVLRGDGTYHAYLRRSDVEREAPPVAPPANSNTAPRYTEDHEIPAWAQRRREREAAASAPPVPVDSSIPTAHSQDYLTPKGLREREEREAAEKLAGKKGPTRRR